MNIKSNAPGQITNYTEIPGLAGELDLKSDTNHNHNGVYPPLVHNHEIADINGLASEMANAGGVAWDGMILLDSDFSVDNTNLYQYFDLSDALQAGTYLIEYCLYLSNTSSTSGYYVQINTTQTDSVNIVTHTKYGHKTHTSAVALYLGTQDSSTSSSLFLIFNTSGVLSSGAVQAGQFVVNTTVDFKFRLAIKQNTAELNAPILAKKGSYLKWKKVA